MELYELSFVKLIKLKDDLVEVIVNDGIEYDLAMLAEYHNWIKQNTSHPCYILVNKINDYTYTFDVQRNLGTIPEIRAIAHVVYTKASKISTEAMNDVPKIRPWNAGIFYTREEALAWLDTQRTT